MTKSNFKKTVMTSFSVKSLLLPHRKTSPNCRYKFFHLGPPTIKITGCASDSQVPCLAFTWKG